MNSNIKRYAVEIFMIIFFPTQLWYIQEQNMLPMKTYKTKIVYIRAGKTKVLP